MRFALANRYSSSTVRRNEEWNGLKLDYLLGFFVLRICCCLPQPAIDNEARAQSARYRFTDASDSGAQGTHDRLW